MEVFKIKISPEVLRNELTTQSYSGVSFGYYSGLSYVLSAGTVNLGTWEQGNPANPGSLGPTNFPLNLSTTDFVICKSGSTGFEWTTYLLNIKTGSTINLTYDNNLYTLLVIEPPIELTKWVRFSISAITVPAIIPNFRDLNLSIHQPNTSQLIDLSIPIFLKQNYEDLGYYSPFDGEFSQLNEEVNFTFTFSDINPYEITIYNTSDNRKTYLQQATYRIDWGDSTPVQDVTVFIPESITHTYLNLPEPTTYTVTFSGVTSLGNYVITKTFDVPYYNTPTINNPFGEVIFETNNGSWSATPQSQNFITYYDVNNTVESQASYNYVSVPFIISGFTTSRLQELKVYGFNPLINDLNINLKDGTLGRVISQSPEYTAYTINDQNYLDFQDGSTVFVVQSYGFLENMLTATTITKMEYLMNVIEQPEIQSNVFIERGKNSGMENFRRIGEVGNTGSLNNYGYKFFDVRNYNEI
jgi:hypothetical protein